MAETDSPMTSANDSFVSLYRRYRPGTFQELRGQDHVVRALRGAIRDGHVGHAYLFSGPRGTGKTSTARILAKALNCLDLADGEPCGVCASCVSITQGNSMDVIELDAASNRGVEAMRDLIGHAALGSPGRQKVYIVDEVHMLSAGAENALLKTLEEPPSHVIFVLATTDPQKVAPTIRSRTQHLEFRLLSGDVLEGLLQDVKTAAGLAVDDTALGMAVRRGHGSARDALSALDQVIASGDSGEIRPGLGDVIEGIVDEDAAHCLVAIVELYEAGWTPAQLAVDLADDLRQAFLLSIEPRLAEVVGADRDRLIDQVTRLGRPRAVRALELIGRAQIDMRDAPDPQIILEVAILRAARSDLDVDVASLAERITRLERRLSELGQAPSATPAKSVAEVRHRQAESGKGPGTYQSPRAKTQAVTKQPLPNSAVADTPQEAQIVENTTAPPVETPTVGSREISKQEFSASWEAIIGQLASGLDRAMYKSGVIVGVDNGVVRIGVSTETHKSKCLASRDLVEAAIVSVLGASLRVEIEVTAAKPARSKSQTPKTPVDEPVEEAIDLDDLVEAPTSAKETIAENRLLEAFPGATQEDA